MTKKSKATKVTAHFDFKVELRKNKKTGEFHADDIREVLFGIADGFGHNAFELFSEEYMGKVIAA